MIRIPLPGGFPFVITAKWDGIKNQFEHVALHFAKGLVLFPVMSFFTGFGIETREGYQNIVLLQGFDLIDFFSRSFGAVLSAYFWFYLGFSPALGLWDKPIKIVIELIIQAHQ